MMRATFAPASTRRALVGASPARPSPLRRFRAGRARPAARDPRLVVIVLRGALDGLVRGRADRRSRLRRPARRRSRCAGTAPHPALPLDGFFGLNPAMANFARLYDAKQALVVHATATNYRERSHFDGQDVLESGMPAPGRTESGWLNRAVAALPTGERVDGAERARGRRRRRRWSCAARRRCSAGRPPGLAPPSDDSSRG